MGSVVSMSLRMRESETEKGLLSMKFAHDDYINNPPLQNKKIKSTYYLAVYL